MMTNSALSAFELSLKNVPMPDRFSLLKPFFENYSLKEAICIGKDGFIEMIEEKIDSCSDDCSDDSKQVILKLKVQLRWMKIFVGMYWDFFKYIDDETFQLYFPDFSDILDILKVSKTIDSASFNHVVDCIYLRKESDWALKIKYINISKMGLDESNFPDIMRLFECFPQVELIDMSSNYFTGGGNVFNENIVKILSDFPKLKYLILSLNPLVSSWAKEFQKFTDIEIAKLIFISPQWVEKKNWRKAVLENQEEIILKTHQEYYENMIIF